MSDTEEREWVVYRTLSTLEVYTGIMATSRDDALNKWNAGEGDLQEDRTRSLIPIFDAVDIKENHD